MVRSIALALLSTVALACATTTDQTATPQASAASPDDHALCVQLMTRSRTCTAAFIPALVDARAAANVPPGIAAQVTADRDGVIAQAKQEWQQDSTDAAIDASCTQTPTLDADRQTALGCLAQADCSAFVSCAVPVFATQFSK
jgi:hypothetical protein